MNISNEVADASLQQLSLQAQKAVSAFVHAHPFSF
jgi:hypothetical protein